MRTEPAAKHHECTTTAAQLSNILVTIKKTSMCTSIVRPVHQKQSRKHALSNGGEFGLNVGYRPDALKVRPRRVLDRHASLRWPARTPASILNSCLPR
ncbi:hypothetical protein Y032_0001g116 [Ancylostoma ceylanicum]|uniref:Uncharacterized protein n=1 Tax=Ancylostoma ceylanicum TaxID=53326 RepID=A0A016W1U2_9BILA|nr:hypothetical protein Y032_0001g116 [Ancylostoma ceylanicum]